MRPAARRPRKASRLMLVLRSVAVWLVILLLAVMNGIFREAVLVPSLSKPVALVVSGLLLSLFILIVAAVSAPWLQLRSSSSSLSVGLLWLCLTLLFEFAFGGLVRGRSL